MGLGRGHNCCGHQPPVWAAEDWAVMMSRADRGEETAQCLHRPQTAVAGVNTSEEKLDTSDSTPTPTHPMMGHNSY